VAAADEAAAAAAMEQLPLFGPLREEFNSWGLTTRGEVRHRLQVDALGRAVETALAAQETRVANAALLAAQGVGSNAGVFARPLAVLTLRELWQLLPRPLLEAALALEFWGGLEDLEAAAEKVEQQGAPASTYAQQQQQALEATFAHRLALAAARPGSGFEFDRPESNSPLAATSKQPLPSRVKLRASKLPHVDEHQITEGQRLSPNCYYGRAAAAAVLRRAHSGWRAALRAHYPLHPMSMAGQPSLLEAQADLCADAGAAWVRTTPPAAAVPTPLDVLASTLAGAAGLGESFGDGSSGGGDGGEKKRPGNRAAAAEAAAAAAQESLKAITFSHEDDDQPTKAGEEPPVVWLLWVAPPELLDANAVANDAVFAEAFATRERKRLVAEEGVREEVRARLLALVGVRDDTDLKAGDSRASRARVDSLLQAANADRAAAEVAQKLPGSKSTTEAQDLQRFMASLKATGRSDGSGEGGTFDVGGTSFDRNPASGTLARMALSARGDDEPEPVPEWVVAVGAVPVLLTETVGTLGTESFSIYAAQDPAATNSQAARRRVAMAVAEAADRRNCRASISFGAEKAGASSSLKKNTSRISFWHDLPLTLKETELAGGGVGAAGGPIANPTVKGRFENQSAVSVLESYSVGRALAAALAVTSGGAVADAEAADLLVQEPPKCRPDLWRPTGSLCWVCECPLNTRRHLRIATRTRHNPLKQDERFGEMRIFARSLFFNLGALPRTWQDPSYAHPALAGADGTPFTVGDNCPVAAVEVGSRAVPAGETRSVKVLGALPVLDQVKAATGKAGGSSAKAILEWILIVIDDTDLWARELQCAEDLDVLAPGSLESIRGLIHDHRAANHAPSDLAGASYCVIGPSVGAEFAIGVVRTAFHCYKRLLQMNWDAAAQTEVDESDEETALSNPGRKRVPPSVWLLKVPEKPTAALVVSLEADEFALLRLSGGLGLEPTFCTSMVSKMCEISILYRTAPRASLVRLKFCLSHHTHAESRSPKHGGHDARGSRAYNEAS
jgi:inorganic pyrophosphatase